MEIMERKEGRKTSSDPNVQKIGCFFLIKKIYIYIKNKYKYQELQTNQPITKINYNGNRTAA